MPQATHARCYRCNLGGVAGWVVAGSLERLPVPLGPLLCGLRKQLLAVLRRRAKDRCYSDITAEHVRGLYAATKRCARSATSS